jgi:hypothetical protein
MKNLPRSEGYSSWPSWKCGEQLLQVATNILRLEDKDKGKSYYFTVSIDSYASLSMITGEEGTVGWAGLGWARRGEARG